MVIRFIRKINATSVTDDRVFIKRFDDTHYSVMFISGEQPNTSKTIYLTAEGVQSYVRTTLYLLHEDADPFELFQIDFALMPSILFRVSALDSSYDGILDAVQFHMDHPLELPYEQLNAAHYVTPPRRPMKANQRQHLFFDSEEEC